MDQMAGSASSWTGSWPPCTRQGALRGDQRAQVPGWMQILRVGWFIVVVVSTCLFYYLASWIYTIQNFVRSICVLAPKLDTEVLRCSVCSLTISFFSYLLGGLSVWKYIWSVLYMYLHKFPGNVANIICKNKKSNLIQKITVEWEKKVIGSSLL